MTDEELDRRWEETPNRIEEEDEDNIICGYCGENISDDNEYCPNCGRKIVDDDIRDYNDYVHDKYDEDEDER